MNTPGYAEGRNRGDGGDSGPTPVSRRDLLRWPLAGLLAGSAWRVAAQTAPEPVAAPTPTPAATPTPFATPAPLPAIPRINCGMNIQPIRHLEPEAWALPAVGPDLVDVQMQLLYELGFSSLRITLTFEQYSPNFLAAIPYVRAARSLGIDVVGIMVDFEGFDLLRALVVPKARRSVVDTYLNVFGGPVEPAPGVPQSGRFLLQVLNEPTHFFGIPPRSYVAEFLAPIYDDVQHLNPEVPVVAAAAVGNVDGVLRLRDMLETGLESVCDYVGLHIYSERLIDMMSGLARRKPVLVTESGATGPRNHQPWVSDVFARIRAGIRGVEEVFYFELIDPFPNRWRVLDVQVDASGAPELRVESPEVLEFWQARVAAATVGTHHASFRELLPDIAAFYPTDQDITRIDSAARSLYG